LKPLLAFVVAILMVFTVFLVITPAVAAPNENASDKGKANAKFTIPKNAVEISHGIFSLGHATDVDGKTVEGIMFIDYKEKHAKPEGTPGKGKKDKNGGDDETNSCFAFIAKGAKWNTPENYLLDPANGDSLEANHVADKVAESMTDWETEAGNEIFLNNIGSNTDGADTSSPDGKNEIFFGNIADEGALAVTIVWYERGGPPSLRDIVEYDMIFDDEFTWDNLGSTSETNLVDTTSFDFWNVAKHEIGHAAGMGHPDSSCTEETMFAFASPGETKKRTLYDGDKAGILDLFS